MSVARIIEVKCELTGRRLRQRLGVPLLTTGSIELRAEDALTLREREIALRRTTHVIAAGKHNAAAIRNIECRRSVTLSPRQNTQCRASIGSGDCSGNRH